MSERFRIAAGIVLILICVLVCVLPAICSGQNGGFRFRTGTKAGYGIPETVTEMKGAVSINGADTDELILLPGIGETLARMIADEEQENGPYYYAEDLTAVKGIGTGTLQRFRDMIDLTQGESGD